MSSSTSTPPTGHDAMDWLAAEPRTARPVAASALEGGLRLCCTREGCTLEHADGSSQTLLASGLSLQISRAEREAPRSALQRLLGAVPPPRSLLVVELRSARGRVVLQAEAPPGHLARLARLNASASATLPLGELEALVDTLRLGGARLAHGTLQVFARGGEDGAASPGAGIDYLGRRSLRGPLQLLAGLVLLVAALPPLAAAGALLPWGAAALAVLPLVALLGALRWRYQRASRERPASLAPLLATVALLLGALAAVVLAMRDGGQVAGALLAAGTMLGTGGVRRWLHGRRLWHRARLDGRGLHGVRRASPREERIGWHEPGALREAALREGSQWLDTTSLVHDALILSRADAATRPDLLERRAAGQSLGPVFADAAEEARAVHWVDRDTTRVGAVMALALGIGLLIGLVALLDGAVLDARVGVVALGMGWFVGRMFNMHAQSAVDRVHGLWVRRVRRGQPSASLYQLDRSSSLTGTALEAPGAGLEGPFVARKHGTTWQVAGSASFKPHVTFVAEQAEAEALAAALNRFLADGTVPPPPAESDSE